MVQIVRILRGTACTVQAANSDVKLYVPEGIHGVLFGKIYTNHARFLSLLSDDCCIISPICEYIIKPFTTGRVLPGKYKLQVPHIVRDIDTVKGHIQVRHLGTQNGSTYIRDVPMHTDELIDDTSFDVDDKYISIHTKQFCKFLITVAGINCCGQSANLLVFASLKNNKERKPVVTVTPYFASRHYEIRDYIEVYLSINLSKVNFSFIFYESNPQHVASSMVILSKAGQRNKAFDQTSTILHGN